MTTNAEQAYESMKATEGQPEGTGEWFEVTQDLINTFADATHDHQFIHVDPEGAKASPFGGTIAHGFLTLSLLTHLIGSIRPDEGAAPRPAPRMEGMLMGVNYGFDKVRFVSPVKSGSKIRAKGVTKAVELKGNAINTTRTITVEIEGEDKPALVADWITRLVFS
jgi:acyl dehydratase